MNTLIYVGFIAVWFLIGTLTLISVECYNNRQFSPNEGDAVIFITVAWPLVLLGLLSLIIISLLVEINEKLTICGRLTSLRKYLFDKCQKFKAQMRED